MLTPLEVESTLQTLKVGKASGPNGLNNLILRELSSQLASPFCSLFNQSLRLGIMPASYKEANVCPVPKKGDLSVTSSYRPIYLLNSESKVFEKTIFKHLYNHLQENNMLSSFQSGFIPGDSTINQLTYLYHTFCETLDSGTEVRPSSVTSAKPLIVFGTHDSYTNLKQPVSKRRFLTGSKVISLTDDNVLFFKVYLLSGTLSEQVCLRDGIYSRASSLSSFHNDIVNGIDSNIRLFADNTSLFIIVDNAPYAAACLNFDFDRITRWTATWLVTFNPSKREALLLSRKLNDIHHPTLYMENVQIQEVKSHKHLGLHLSSDCSWHQHISYIKDKAWLRINIMRKLIFKLDRKSLETIYTTSIRPLLEYGDNIWDNCTQTEKYELDKIQNEAARIATGATKLVSINNLYKEICWESLQKRRNDHKLTYSLKCMFT